MTAKSKKLRRMMATGAVVAGAGLGAAGIASAATSSSTSTSTTASSASSNMNPPPGAAGGAAPSGSAGDPAAMTHGPGETLLTGSNLQSATAAATAAVPGATVIRAETDSSGASPYEVHMKKADGTYVTVELDSSFKVVTTVSGFGAGPPGGGPPGSASAPPASSSASA